MPRAHPRHNSTPNAPASVLSWWGEGPTEQRQQWWHSDPPILLAPVAFIDYHAEVVHSVPGLAETAQYKW